MNFKKAMVGTLLIEKEILTGQSPICSVIRLKVQ